jgi:hypothetical protein
VGDAWLWVCLFVALGGLASAALLWRLLAPLFVASDAGDASERLLGLPGDDRAGAVLGAGGLNGARGAVDRPAPARTDAHLDSVSGKASRSSTGA